MRILSGGKRDYFFFFFPCPSTGIGVEGFGFFGVELGIPGT